MPKFSVEEWRPVVGHERYKVSNLGRFARLDGKISSYKPRKDGYVRVTLEHHNHKQLHELVINTFLTNDCPTKTQINHINGIRSDNRLENLEYVTPIENANKKIFPSKSKTLKIEQINMYGKVIKVWNSLLEAATYYHISSARISQVCKSGGTAKGYKWRYLKEKINYLDLDNEKWKTIIYDNFKLSASSEGRVMLETGYKTFGAQTRAGYFNLNLSGSLIFVHRIICTAFHGPCPIKGYVVNHKDNNGKNNKPENLEWVSRSYNTKHGLAFHPKNMSVFNRKSVEQHSIEGKYIQTFCSITDAARSVGLTSSPISKVLRNKMQTAGGFKWKYASG